MQLLFPQCCIHAHTTHVPMQHTCPCKQTCPYSTCAQAAHVPMQHMCPSSTCAHAAHVPKQHTCPCISRTYAANMPIQHACPSSTGAHARCHESIMSSIDHVINDNVINKSHHESFTSWIDHEMCETILLLEIRYSDSPKLGGDIGAWYASK